MKWGPSATVASMVMEPGEMTSAMSTANAAVQAWQDRVNAIFRERWQFADGFGEALRAASESARSAAGPTPLPELYGLLDRVADSYLAAGEEDRSAIRRLVGENRAVLHKMYWYIGHTATRVRETCSPAWLRRGLAAASIEDARRDYRDLYMALGNLYLEATRAGIDPGPAFREIGRLSNRGLAGPLSTAEMLENFEQSAFFSADVKPKVGQDT